MRGPARGLYVSEAGTVPNCAKVASGQTASANNAVLSSRPQRKGHPPRAHAGHERAVRRTAVNVGSTS